MGYFFSYLKKNHFTFHITYRTHFVLWTGKSQVFVRPTFSFYTLLFKLGKHKIKSTDCSRQAFKQRRICRISFYWPQPPLYGKTLPMWRKTGINPTEKTFSTTGEFIKIVFNKLNCSLRVGGGGVNLIFDEEHPCCLYVHNKIKVQRKITSMITGKITFNMYRSLIVHRWGMSWKDNSI